MSVDNYFFIGAYATVEVGMILKKTRSKKCPNGHSVSHIQENLFCVYCGRELVWQDGVSFAYPRLDDFLSIEGNGDDQVVSCPHIVSLPKNQFVVISNQEHGDMRVCASDDGSIMPITPEDVVVCLREFESGHADVLAILRRECKSVVVSFGFLQWSME